MTPWETVMGRLEEAAKTLREAPMEFEELRRAQLDLQALYHSKERSQLVILLFLDLFINDVCTNFSMDGGFTEPAMQKKRAVVLDNIGRALARACRGFKSLQCAEIYIKDMSLIASEYVRSIRLLNESSEMAHLKAPGSAQPDVYAKTHG